MTKGNNVIGRFGALLLIAGAAYFTANFERIASCTLRPKGAKTCCLIEPADSHK